jgi:hypothetical protein
MQARHPNSKISPIPALGQGDVAEKSAGGAAYETDTDNSRKCWLTRMGRSRKGGIHEYHRLERLLPCLGE